MIKPWRYLNTRGKVLAIACVTNIWVAVYMAYEGEWMSIFSGVMAAFCGMMTYFTKYQHQDATDINESKR